MLQKSQPKKSIYYAIKGIFRTFTDKDVESLQEGVIEEVRDEEPKVARELERVLDMRQGTRETREKIQQITQDIRDNHLD